jgi:hypothetical protein
MTCAQIPKDPSTKKFLFSLAALLDIFEALLCHVKIVKISDPNPVSVSLIFQPKLNAQTQF